MSRVQHFPHLTLGAALLALIFGAASVHPQSVSEGGKSGSAGTSSSATQGSKAGDTSKSSSGSASGGASGTSSATGSSASGSPAASSSTDKSASKNGSMSKADQNLMREMAQANLAEIQAGKLAMEKSQSDQVKKFAQQMIDDHTKANGELQQLAQSKGVTLPNQPDKQHQAMVKKMGTMSGAEFDRNYMAQGGVRDHKNTHTLLQRAETRAKDPDLKALAGKMLPIVDRHLAMAQEMQGSKAGTASGASGAKGASASSSAGKEGGSSATDGKSGASAK